MKYVRINLRGKGSEGRKNTEKKGQMKVIGKKKLMIKTIFLFIQCDSLFHFAVTDDGRE